MSRILRATISAKNEEQYLFLEATIDVEEDKGPKREAVEAKLQDFVARTSLTMGMIYECSPVVWRQRGNRNRLTPNDLSGGGSKAQWGANKTSK